MRVSESSPEPVAPPAFLRLAGHPLRWRLLSELARSDRMVHELTGLVGHPQNLVSYHLGKLRDARLVSARRSSADRRDAYYTVDLTRVGDLLAAAGAALHPGASIRARRRARSGTGRRGFGCCSCARATAPVRRWPRPWPERRSGGGVEAYSAGSHPKPLHPNAVRVMRDEYGIDIAGQRSKHLSVFADQRFDWVISLCDRVREVCPEFPGSPETVHWSIPDPTAGHPDGDEEASYPAFKRTAAELETRIGFLLGALTRPMNPAPTTAQEES